MYDASRNTVRQAISFLLTRGVVEKESSGATLARKKIDPFRTVVSADTGFGGFEGAAYASDVQASNRTPKVTTPRVEIQEAAGDIAVALQLSQGASVVIRHHERFIDDYLWSMQTSYYPMTFVEQGASRLLAVKDIAEGTDLYLDETIGVKEIGSHDTMTVRAPTPGEAACFGLPEDGRIAVFETRQIGVDPKHKPVRITITIYPSDRNTFSMETRSTDTENSPVRRCLKLYHEAEVCGVLFVMPGTRGYLFFLLLSLAGLMTQKLNDVVSGEQLQSNLYVEAETDAHQYRLGFQSEAAHHCYRCSVCINYYALTASAHRTDWEEAPWTTTLSGAKIQPVPVTWDDRRGTAVRHDGRPCPSVCST